MVGDMRKLTPGTARADLGAAAKFYADSKAPVSVGFGATMAISPHAKCHVRERHAPRPGSIRGLSDVDGGDKGNPLTGRGPQPESRTATATGFLI